VRLPSVESDARGTPPSPGSAAAGRGDGPWVLQADAAKQAGCSVSAIRKWRREGSVASRKVTTPAGLERVEVRLEDVLRRAGPRDRTSPDPVPGTDLRLAVPGTVLVPISDFQALVERVALAEQLAGGLETRLRAIDAEASRMREQFVELRRQIEHERRREERLRPPAAVAEPPPAPRSSPPPPALPAPPPPAPPAPAVSAPVTGPSPDRPEASPDAPPPATTRPLREARPAPSPDRPAPPPSSSFRQWLGARKPPEAPAPPPVDVERLAAELRRLYGRLQARQGQAEVSPAEAERWVADLAAYDAALVRVCRTVGIPAAFRVGERIPAPDRIALSRALAAAGVDVRVSQPTAP
jgi:hypothetical protein